MPMSVVYTGQPMTGTANDDYMIAYAGSTGTSANTVNAGGGDDWVLGDSSDTWIPNASYLNGSIGTAFNLETITSTWTTDENPLFGNTSTPHTTAIVEATIGQSEFFRVNVGAGQTITIDIDFASGSALGTSRDLIVELMDAGGNILATGDDSLITDGGLGSFPSAPGSQSSYDPLLIYTPAGAGTYYINVRPFGGGPGSTFTENNTFLLNLSVGGHATNASATVMDTDTIHGNDGDDYLFGQGAVDIIYGDAGNDLIHGGSGYDTLLGGADNDTIYGGDGTEEEVRGGSGDDILYSGGEGHYYGEEGNDTIYAGLTSGVNEVLDGGADIDTIDTSSWNGSYEVNLAAGTTNFGEIFTNFENVVSGNGEDIITGTGGDNVITTRGGIDNVQAGGGNDRVAGGAEGDTLNGGDGIDTLDYGLSNDAVTIALATNSASGGHAAGDSISNFENVIGSVLGDTLSGSDGANRLTGNAGSDVLDGGAGNDVLDGGINDDIMTGGLGDDFYYLDSVGDVFTELAGEGNDTIAVAFSFSIAAQTGIDNIEAIDAAAITAINLTGNGLDNRIAGNAGANQLSGAGGIDTLDYRQSNAGVTVSLASNNVSGGHAAGDVISGFENVIGSGFVDILVGNSLANVIAGRGGGDTLNGAGGLDTLDYGSSAVGVVVSLAANTASGGDAAGDTIVNFENLTGSAAGGDTLTGDGTANILLGLGGIDFLYGLDGADTIDGGAGADRMEGGAGDDTYWADHESDLIVEAGDKGNDTVYASANFTITSNIESLVLVGSASIAGAGNNSHNNITGNSGANVLAGREGEDRLDGGLGADTLKGGIGNDVYVIDNIGDKAQENAGEGVDAVESWITYVLPSEIELLKLIGVAAIDGTGNTVANTISGNGAANRLNGLGGADKMDGGNGDDTYVVENAGDQVTELAGKGDDTVESSIGYTLTANVENLVLTGAAANAGAGNDLANRITGNGAANVLAGREGADRLDGGGGADTLKGGLGDDLFIVDNIGDVVQENAGEGNDTIESSVTYTLSGEVETLKLTGLGNINGFGNAGVNTLIGNTANNEFHSGLGSDTLTGGEGLDAYWFETALGAANVDTVTDYNVAADTIILDRTIFAGIAANGALAAGAFRTGAAAIDADDRILYDAATGNLWYDADGVGGAAAVRFAQIAAGLSVTYADFIAVA